MTGILGRIVGVGGWNTGRNNIGRIVGVATFKIEVICRFAWTTWFLLSLLLLMVEVTITEATWLRGRFFLVWRSGRRRRRRGTRKGKRIQRRRRHVIATYTLVYRSDLAVLCLVLDEHRRGSFLQFIGTVGTVDDEDQLLGDEFVREFRFGRW